MDSHRLAIAALAVLILIPPDGACAQEPEAPRPRKIAVFGSSVAHGSVDHEGRGGYAGRFGDLLAPRGWEVVNVSRGGDSTVSIVPRFDAELIPQKPGYVLIGLSLSNEGIAKQADKAWRDGVWEQWRSGMRELIGRCRAAGMDVVVGNCYARTTFAEDPDLYAYTRRMNLEISTWDVPSVNFLGAIDDGRGAWVEGFDADAGHPNGSGHQEMMLAIVPTLFDALAAGKPMPGKADGNRFARIAGAASAAPLVFTPADLVHSFAVSFRVRPAGNGALAAVAGTNAVIRTDKGERDGRSYRAGVIEPGERRVEPAIACRDGAIVYTGTEAELSSAPAESAQWRHVVLSHACARGTTELYVDGALAGSVQERFIPEAFLLGGGAAETAAAGGDFREWTVYRSSLNADEVRFMYEGGLYQASLEVYAPLADAAFTPGGTVQNLAQSMSEVRVVAAGATPAAD